MTITVDSIFVLLGICVVFGFGGFLGVFYAVIFLRACNTAGECLVNSIICPLYIRVSSWWASWKK